MRTSLPVLDDFATRLRELGWVRDVLVAGSVATGDYRPGVSDLDLAAVVDGPVEVSRTRQIVSVHRDVDEGVGRGLNLGCVYVDQRRLRHQVVQHPTWTHGRLVSRVLSGVSRAELVRHGYAVFGRRPVDLLPAMSDEGVRAAVRDEVGGYWAWAARRPWLWLDPVLADLGLTAMARARHTVATGELLSKSAALDRVAAPVWLADQLRARRNGEAVTSPRVRTGLIAWLDAVRTVARVRRHRLANPGMADRLGPSVHAREAAMQLANLRGELGDGPLDDDARRDVLDGQCAYRGRG